MPEWSEQEDRIAVEAYLGMLRAELEGGRINKAAVRREVLPQLDGRSDGALEFKNCNISAALLDLGYPAIDGYKPRWNYQVLLLPKVVNELIAADGALREALASYVTATHDLDGKLSLLLDEPPPEIDAAYRVREEAWDWDGSPPPPPRHINFLEVESRNAALGLAGEELVVGYERARLADAGRDELAGRVEHVSKDRGDGAGFDIRSFEEDGRIRFIEVKTFTDNLDPLALLGDVLRLKDDR